MKRPSFSLLLTQLLILATLAGVGVAVAFGYADAEHRSDIIVELAKALFQLALVAVAGGIVSHLINDYVRKRTDAENAVAALNHLRAEFLSEFRTSYYLVKSVRRALRAAGLTSKFGRAPSLLTDSQQRTYFRAMKALNRVQIDLEQLQISIESLHGFSDGKDSLAASLRTMENYLRRILTEFEDRSASVENSSQRLDFQSLEALEDFTRSSEGTLFKAEFSSQFRHAWIRLSRELLPVNAVIGNRSPVKYFGEN